MVRVLLLSLLVILVAVTYSYSAPAYAGMGLSGLPLPRFVSLRTDEANVRTGPGMQYPKKWVLVKRNIPLEIISEYEEWRKIRDIQGDEGWIHKAMLTGKRSGIVKKNNVKIYRKPDIASQVKAVLENGVLVKISSCNFKFCKVSISDVDGYMISANLWGVYIGEKIK